MILKREHHRSSTSASRLEPTTLQLEFRLITTLYNQSGGDISIPMAFLKVAAYQRYQEKEPHITKSESLRVWTESKDKVNWNSKMARLVDGCQL